MRSSATVDSHHSAEVSDLSGEHYIATLDRLHKALRPKTYLEIGVFTGQSLALSRCASIAIDPAFKIDPLYLPGVLDKPKVHFFAMGSDKFFGENDPSAILDAKIDMAFLDGMHRCEFLLRDFVNVERYCKPNSVIALHDCLPVDAGIVDRSPEAGRSVTQVHRAGWWAGDVWRTSLLLRRYRPDLQMTVLDCQPTGLVLITGLDPTNDSLRSGYSRFVSEMISWDLAEIGIGNLFAEMRVMSTDAVATDESITRHFWL